MWSCVRRGRSYLVFFSHRVSSSFYLLRHSPEDLEGFGARGQNTQFANRQNLFSIPYSLFPNPCFYALAWTGSAGSAGAAAAAGAPRQQALVRGALSAG